ncbi:hypothetical protein AB751O23_AC_00130 [Chlamydiales bacterium SCGC AB-751-O23]|jgi:hypothetical protein|nr:hypothetical protein AB751O23_AC_00130 [Chlamydiales bacterium SCGC AB-751-O23]
MSALTSPNSHQNSAKKVTFDSNIRGGNGSLAKRTTSSPSAKTSSEDKVNFSAQKLFNSLDEKKMQEQFPNIMEAYRRLLAEKERFSFEDYAVMWKNSNREDVYPVYLSKEVLEGYEEPPEGYLNPLALSSFSSPVRESSHLPNSLNIKTTPVREGGTFSLIGELKKKYGISSGRNAALCFFTVGEDTYTIFASTDKQPGGPHAEIKALTAVPPEILLRYTREKNVGKSSRSMSFNKELELTAKENRDPQKVNESRNGQSLLLNYFDERASTTSFGETSQENVSSSSGLSSVDSSSETEDEGDLSMISNSSSVFDLSLSGLSAFDSSKMEESFDDEADDEADEDSSLASSSFPSKSDTKVSGSPIAGTTAFLPKPSPFSSTRVRRRVEDNEQLTGVLRERFSLGTKVLSGQGSRLNFKEGTIQMLFSERALCQTGISTHNCYGKAQALLGHGPNPVVIKYVVEHPPDDLEERSKIENKYQQDQCHQCGVRQGGDLKNLKEVKKRGRSSSFSKSSHNIFMEDALGKEDSRLFETTKSPEKKIKQKVGKPSSKKSRKIRSDCGVTRRARQPKPLADGIMQGEKSFMKTFLERSKDAI